MPTHNQPDINKKLTSFSSEKAEQKSRLFSHVVFSSTGKEYLFSVLIVMLAVLLCIPIADELGYQSVSFLFLFVVSLLALVFRIGPVLMSSTLMALAWNFIFIPPKYTFSISKTDDLLIFLMFFIIALINGVLTSRLKKQKQLARNSEKRSKALFHLTNQLVSVKGHDNIVFIAKQEIKKHFGIDSFFLLAVDGQILKRTDLEMQLEYLSKSDYNIAAWVLNHVQKAGKFTNTLPSTNYTYFPLKGLQTQQGVVAVNLGKPFDRDSELFWVTFLAQISNALEHDYLANLAQHSSLLDESDKLYKTIFNSISHELRIPVATIMGASDTLLSNEYPKHIRAELYDEIFTASKRLNRLIENLLNMSRLESGKIAPRMDWCDMNDLFNQVLESLKDELKPFQLHIDVSPTIPLVKLDFGLMEQVLYNLLLNSCKYAKETTEIRLNTYYDGESLVIEEMDRGKGFTKEIMPFIFDRFYKKENQETGGLGLGLSIVKGFVEAQKGTVSAKNRVHGGVKFTIKIPVEASFPNNLMLESNE